VRTEKNMQAVDSWCAWRTLQTEFKVSEYLEFMEFCESGDDILKTFIYLDDASGIEDAMKYIDMAVNNSRHR
jgi:hypothetical protein